MYKDEDISLVVWNLEPGQEAVVLVALHAQHPLDPAVLTGMLVVGSSDARVIAIQAAQPVLAAGFDVLRVTAIWAPG